MAEAWFTSAELAGASLPALPKTRQGLEKLIEAQEWRANPTLARRRKARGGGWEYHLKLLPEAARLALAKRKPPQKPANPHPKALESQELWARFERLPEKDKAQAKTRLRMVQAVVKLGAHSSLGNAVAGVASQHKVSERSLWRWYELTKGITPRDHLAVLAPQHRFGQVKALLTPLNDAFMKFLITDYLRPERPSFTACYDCTKRVAEINGWAVPHLMTARRHFDRQVPPLVRVFRREGDVGLARKFPPQIRDKSGMVAMEGVNADVHKWDVFVKWFDGTIMRPQMVAFQDLFSGKILSWRVDTAPNMLAVMQAFGEMVENFGIPRHLTFDNGREFANKWLTGGCPSRFRFKIRPDDPVGVMPQMGIDVHWATPGHGQAKPIERAFRDMADYIAKDPRFAGAYTGHKADAKPDNYKSRAIDAKLFLKVVAEGIAAHNAREGRRGHVQNGRSFDATFAESYATAPITKATEEQRRLWLMGQEVRKLHSGHGALTLFKNEYWSEWMNDFAGERVVARFNPENLHEGLSLYQLDGVFLGGANIRDKSGFYDLTEAREFAKIDKARKGAVKRYAREMERLDARELVAMLDQAAPPEGASEAPLESKVVALPRRARKAPQRGQEKPPAPSAEQARAHADFVTAFEARRQSQAQETTETAETRFARACALEGTIAEGGAVRPEDHAWLQTYQSTAEYRGQKRVRDDFAKNNRKEG